MVTRQATRLKQSSKRNSTHPMNAASEFHSTGGGGSGSDSTNTSGYTWPGGATTQVERLAEARRHRRKQQGMCGRHMRKVEEEASLSLDAQVHLITERQADMEAKQEQRLESLASALTSLKEGMVREGLIAASPRSHRSVAPSLQGSPTNHLPGGGLRAPSHRPPPDRPAGGGGGGSNHPVPPLALDSALQQRQRAERRVELSQQRLEQTRLAQLQQRSRATPTAVETLGPVPSSALERAKAAAAKQQQQPQSGLLGFTPTVPPTIAAKLGMQPSSSLNASAGPTPQASPFGTGPSTPLEKLVGRAPAAATPTQPQAGGGGGASSGGWFGGGVRVTSQAAAPGMASVREERR